MSSDEEAQAHLDELREMVERQAETIRLLRQALEKALLGGHDVTATREIARKALERS